MFTKYFFFTILWYFNIQGLCCGLHIERLTIPKAVRANSSEVILDCKYKLEEWETKNAGFVLKWYINSVNLVYQWIPPRRPQILGYLKGHVDMSYTSTYGGRMQGNSALRIINPDPSLSGTYTCTVATFEEEDSDSGKLLIWAPPSEIRVKYSRPSIYIVNVTCSSIDVSPKPLFTLYKISPGGKRHAIPIQGRSDFPGSSAGLYDSHSWGLVVYKTTKEESVIGCSVSTRGKMFFETRETIYHADIPVITTTTTTTSTPRPDEEAIKSPSIASLAISYQRPNKAIGFKIALLLFIVFLSRERSNQYLC